VRWNLKEAGGKVPFLGHVDIKTTEIYARTDTETKRKAIVNAYPDLIDTTLPDWNKD